MKLGVAQMDWKILKTGGGGGVRPALNPPLIVTCSRRVRSTWKRACSCFGTRPPESLTAIMLIMTSRRSLVKAHCWVTSSLGKMYHPALAREQVEAQHQMWKVSQIWQTYQIWWYRILTPAPEMTQFSIQSIEEIIQSWCCQMFSTT